MREVTKKKEEKPLLLFSLDAEYRSLIYLEKEFSPGDNLAGLRENQSPNL
jgi:hypothetical protein